MNYLASPPLVVAYALAGRMDIDLTKEPIGTGVDGKPVFLSDVWPSPEEVRATMAKAVKPEHFKKAYGEVFDGDERWKTLPVPEGRTYAWQNESTYVRRPPFFEAIPKAPSALEDIRGARVLAVLGDSVTTDHISPAGSIAKTSPAAKYLTDHSVDPKDFNSYGARRGNHEVMMRGTFGNIRLRNLLVPGSEGNVTRAFRERNEQMSIYDASMKYQAAKTPLVVLAGAEYGTGSSRDWAAKGTLLLGVKAVIAKSFERIHRSNLAGMGVLPLQFEPGEDARNARAHRPRDFRRRKHRGGPEAEKEAPGHRDGREGAKEVVHRHRAPRHAERGRLLPPRRHPHVRAEAARGGVTRHLSIRI